jgi:hypothetical protein
MVAMIHLMKQRRLKWDGKTPLVNIAVSFSIEINSATENRSNPFASRFWQCGHLRSPLAAYTKRRFSQSKIPVTAMTIRNNSPPRIHPNQHPSTRLKKIRSSGVLMKLGLDLIPGPLTKSMIEKRHVAYANENQAALLRLKRHIVAMVPAIPTATESTLLASDHGHKAAQIAKIAVQPNTSIKLN